MTFTQGLISSGYVLDTENFDDCYVKTDSEGVLHLYQEGEDDNEWNYVTMDDDFNVISEKTFTLTLSWTNLKCKQLKSLKSLKIQ